MVKISCMDAQDSPAPAAQGPSSAKRIHNLVVDTGPLIKNEPALSTLLSQADEIYTIPSVLTEIKVSTYPSTSPLAH